MVTFGLLSMVIVERDPLLINHGARFVDARGA